MEHGRYLLKQGIRWGISDGKMVKITGDNWVPKFPPGLLKSTSPIPESATIHCLIDETTNTWNQESVHALFPEVVVERILRVPIALHVSGDFAFWHFTPHGIQRSAYIFARSSKFFKTQSATGKGVSSNWEENEKGWNAIWGIQAPGKMKIHLWCFVHDCLPNGVWFVR
jgi:hypothetical protein